MWHLALKRSRPFLDLFYKGRLLDPGSRLFFSLKKRLQKGFSG